MNRLPEPRYKVEGTQEARRHFYTITRAGESKRVPSVTGSLSVIDKPALVNWTARTVAKNIEAALIGRLRGEESNRIVLSCLWISEVIAEGRKRPAAVASEAADLGTLLHSCFDAILRGQEPPVVPEQARPAMDEFRKWYASSGISIVATELPVGSWRDEFGGRLDFLGVKNDAYGIVDFKTGSGIYVEAALQTAAYAKAVEEQYGIPIKWVDIVRFAKKEPYGSEVKPVISLDQAHQAFLYAHALSRMIKADYLGQPIYTTFLYNEAKKLQSASEERVREKIRKGEAPF